MCKAQWVVHVVNLFICLLWNVKGEGMCGGRCGCCPSPCHCTCVPTGVPANSHSAHLYPKCSGQMDVCLIMDSSVSVDSSQWRFVLQFMKDIVNSFTDIGDGGAKFGIILFSLNATVHWDLSSKITESRAELLEAIDSLEFEAGPTNIPEALLKAFTEVLNAQGDRSDVINRCVFVSDGKSATPNNRFIPGYAAALHTSARVVSIGVGEHIDHTTLEVIGSDRARGFFTVLEVSQLTTLVDKVVKAICPPMSLVQPKQEEECFCCCPPPPGIVGYHKLRH